MSPLSSSPTKVVCSTNAPFDGTISTETPLAESSSHSRVGTGPSAAQVTSRTRASFAPDIRTIYEAGFPALAVETTAGLYGPAGMSRELRERLSKDVLAVVSDPVISERMVATGQAINLGGPEDLSKTLKQQAEQMATVAKALGLKANK